MTFDFDPNDKNNTKDSNVVQTGTSAESLTSVNNGSYIVGTGSCSSSSIGGPAIISTPSAQPKTLDQFVDQKGKGPGTPELTFMIAIVGSVLTVLGILGLALL